MKKKLLSIVFILALASNVNAQSSFVKIWDKRYGGFEKERVKSLLQSTDRGFLLSGFSMSDSSGDKTQNCWHEPSGNYPTYDYWVVKTDSSGSKQWDKRFGGESTDILSSVEQTNDGGYILIGGSSSKINGDKSQANWDTSLYSTYDFWIVKINAQGTKLWDKVYGGLKDDFPNASAKTSDGGFLIGGNSWSGIGGDKTQANWDTVVPITNDFWVIKIDSTGTKIWDKRYGGTDEDKLISIKRTDEGGYILGGWSASGIGGDKTQPNWGSYDYWIIKIDSAGNQLWDKRFGSVYIDRFMALEQTKDGGYILGGNSEYYASGDRTQNCLGNQDFWIVKINSAGIIQWEKVFGGAGGEDELSMIIETCGESYLIAGSSYSDSSGTKSEDNMGVEQTWMIRIDSLGNRLWDKTIQTPGHDEECFLVQLSDQCFAMANYYFIYPAGGFRVEQNWDTANYWTDMWMMKFCDSALATGCNPVLGITTYSSQSQLFIYPNPSDGKFIVEILGMLKQVQHDISIYDIVGEKIFEQKIISEKTEIHLSNQPNGIYFVAVRDEKNNLVVRKVVKM
jgi:hypothetical protein